MKRILFLKFGALGDVLMTTPLLRQTRRVIPDAEINYCVAEPFAGVLQSNPHLNRLITFDPAIFTKRKVGGLINLARELRTQRYDLVFVLDKHFVFALTAWLTGIQHRVGFKRDRLTQFFLTRSAPYGGMRHDIHSNLDLLGEIASVDYSDTRMEFVPTPSTIGKFQLPSAYFVCANSGGENVRESGNIRRLPRDKFLELLGNLVARQPTVLLGGKHDRDYYATLTLPANVVNLAGETSLGECAHIIGRAEKCFTTDCGLMHLAATTETPIYAFFGPTHPERKAPLRENVEWFWADEGIYDQEYDRRGRVPRGDYFSSLDVRHLFDPGTRGSLQHFDRTLATVS